MVDGNQCFESSSAMLVPFYQTKWHHIPEDNNLFPERRKSLSEKRSFTTKKILGIEQSDLLLTQGKNLATGGVWHLLQVWECSKCMG